MLFINNNLLNKYEYIKDYFRVYLRITNPKVRYRVFFEDFNKKKKFKNFKGCVWKFSQDFVK